MEINYRIIYSDIVITQHLSKLSAPIKKRIRNAIETRLITNPILHGKPLRQSYRGHRRLRISDYRVIYRVDETSNTVFIVAIGHRKDIYGR